MHFQAPVLVLAAGASLAVAAPTHWPENFFVNTHNRLDLADTVHNDLVDGSPCKDVTLIYARGTWGIGGNFGDSVGHRFARALGEKVGVDNIAVQGVEYPASVGGFLKGGSGTGSEKMRELTGGVMNRCPDTKVVLSGYSQGAQVVHKAIDWMHPEFAEKIAGVVTFGDPYWKEGYNHAKISDKVEVNRVRMYCNPKDTICNGGLVPALVTPYHWTYAKDAVEGAAQWTAKTIGEELGMWNVAKKNIGKWYKKTFGDDSTHKDFALEDEMTAQELDNEHVDPKEKDFEAEDDNNANRRTSKE